MNKYQLLSLSLQFVSNFRSQREERNQFTILSEEKYFPTKPFKTQLIHNTERSEVFGFDPVRICSRSLL